MLTDISAEKFLLPSLKSLQSKVDVGGLPAVMREHKRGRTTGTTVLAMHYCDGVVIAGDRRGTEIHVRDDEHVKIEETGNLTMIACSGTVSYIQDLVSTLKLLREMFEEAIAKPIYADGQSQLLTKILKANFSYLNILMYILGYYAVPLIAGYDPELKRGWLFGFDEQGGRYPKRDFVTSGSGGEFAGTILEDRWKQNMSEAEAVRLAVRAILRASKDVYTSPPSLAPVTARSVSAKGIRYLPEDRALRLAWDVYLRDLRAGGKKEQLSYFRRKGGK